MSQPDWTLLKQKCTECGNEFPIHELKKYRKNQYCKKCYKSIRQSKKTSSRTTKSKQKDFTKISSQTMQSSQMQENYPYTPDFPRSRLYSTYVPEFHPIEGSVPKTSIPTKLDISSRFIGRSQELNTVSQFFASVESGILSIVGDKKIGKTRLIMELLRSWKAIYHNSQDFGNLEVMFTSLKNDFPIFNHLKPTLNTLLSFVAEQNKILILDHAELWIEEFPQFWEELQKVSWEKSQLKIVLIYPIAYETLFPINNLSHIHHTKVELQKLKFSSLPILFPNLNFYELLVQYLFSGGYPGFFAPIGDDQSFRSWFQFQFQYFPEKFRDDLRLQFLDARITRSRRYSQILYALSRGNNTTKKLRQFLGISATDLSPYLVKMCDLKILEQEPILLPPDIIDSSSPSKSAPIQYRIRNLYFGFYFAFLYQIQNRINVNHNLHNHISKNNINPQNPADFILNPIERCLDLLQGRGQIEMESESDFQYLEMVLFSLLHEYLIVKTNASINSYYHYFHPALGQNPAWFFHLTNSEVINVFFCLRNTDEILAQILQNPSNLMFPGHPWQQIVLVHTNWEKISSTRIVSSIKENLEYFDLPMLARLLDLK